MIKTKSILEPPAADDGERILISRGYPHRHREDLQLSEQTPWLKLLAPSLGLLKAWKEKEVTWTEYTEIYNKEMSFEMQQQAISELAERAEEEVITLLCFEPEDDEHCHRHLLKEMIVRVMEESE